MIIIDELGVIKKVSKKLPRNLSSNFLEAISELENKKNFIEMKFPKTNLHKVSGTKENIYRADINKDSAYRIHLQYGESKNTLYLKDFLTNKEHDKVNKVINARKNRYT